MVARHHQSLPDDIVIDVLHRISTVDLCRWRCVSKQWHQNLVPSILSKRPNLTLFTKPEVSNLTRPSFLSLSSDGSVVYNDLVAVPLQSPLSTMLADKNSWPIRLIQGVCNGLTLYSFFSKPTLISTDKGRISNFTGNYTVFNPFTCKTYVIDLPPHAKYNEYDPGFLAFDPRISAHTFKIISHFNRQKPFVYSSRTKEWLPLIIEKPPIPKEYNTVSTTYSYCVNGKAYKLASLGFSYEEMIVALDVEKESLWSITSPVGRRVPTPHNDEHCIFGETSGHICYGLIDFKLLNFRVWALHDHHSSDSEWICMHNVKLKAVDGPIRSNILTGASDFSFHPSDEEALFVDARDWTLFLYKFKTLEVREITKLESFVLDSVYPYLCPN